MGRYDFYTMPREVYNSRENAYAGTSTNSHERLRGFKLLSYVASEGVRFLWTVIGQALDLEWHPGRRGSTRGSLHKERPTLRSFLLRSVLSVCAVG